MTGYKPDYIDWRRPIKAPQPKKCKGCSYGRFDGVKQFCMLPRCVKESRRKGETHGRP